MTDSLRKDMTEIESRIAEYENRQPEPDADVREFLPRTIEILQALYGITSKVTFRLSVDCSDLLGIQFQAHAYIKPLGTLTSSVNSKDPEEPSVLNNEGSRETLVSSGDSRDRLGFAFKSLHERLVKEITSKLQKADNEVETLRNVIERLSVPVVSLNHIWSATDPDSEDQVS